MSSTARRARGTTALAATAKSARKGKKDATFDRVGKLGDDCTGMHGFVIFGSLSGDAGADFGLLLRGLLSAVLARREAGVDSLPGSSGRWSRR
jgi:hypothetical protein